MSFFYVNKKKKHTASVAKKRLQIIISHERQKKNAPDYFPQLQKEILDIICKHIDIDKNRVKVQFDKSGNDAVLAVNVTLPQNVIKAA